jgi:hypothetical protein
MRRDGHRRTGTLGSRKSLTDKALDAVAASSRLERSKRRSPMRGGMIPVTGRTGLDQLSWVIPARWGFAASSSTTDLGTIAPVLQTKDTLWSHHTGWWGLDMTALIVLGVVLAGCVCWRIRLNTAALILDRIPWYRRCIWLPRGIPLRRWSRRAWAYA